MGRSMTGVIYYDEPDHWLIHRDIKMMGITNISFISKSEPKCRTIKFEDYDKNLYEISIEGKSCRICKFFKKNECDVNYTMDGWRNLYGFIIKDDDINLTMTYGSMR